MCIAFTVNKVDKNEKHYHCCIVKVNPLPIPFQTECLILSSKLPMTVFQPIFCGYILPGNLINNSLLESDVFIFGDVCNTVCFSADWELAIGDPLCWDLKNTQVQCDVMLIWRCQKSARKHKNVEYNIRFKVARITRMNKENAWEFKGAWIFGSWWFL